jgi:hypothetical protein
VELLADLVGVMTPEKMNALAGHGAPMACWQRLGFILETVLKSNVLADAVYRKIGPQKLYSIALDPKKKNKKYNGKNRWKVVVNTQLELDT